MGLKNRIDFFDLLCSKFPCDRPSPLIAVHKIDEYIYDRLRSTVMLYVSRCLVDAMSHDEENILEELELRRDQIRNVTPNGLIKPYRHLSLEFNMLYMVFADFIRSLNISSCAQAFYGLIDVRYKEGNMYERNIGRDYSTEDLHLDPWSIGINDCIRILMPILGDSDCNRVEFYSPPDHFKESWLDKLPSYAAGAEIAKQYSPVDVSVPRGSVCFFDFAVLHRTVRTEKAGGRVSLGNSIYSKVPENERTGPARPYLTYNDLMSIGKDRLLAFSSFDEHNDPSKGAKHWELVSAFK